MASRFLLGISLVFTFAGVSFAAEVTGNSLKDLKELDAKEIKLGEDEPGCKDPGLLPRLQGCNIIQCGSKANESLEIQTGASPEGAPSKEVAEGQTEILYYLCPAKLTSTSIVKQAEALMLKNGFKAVYLGKDGDEMPLVTMQKEDEYVQISTYSYNSYSAYVYTSVKVAPEPPSTADGMAEELKGRGQFVLAGVNFGVEGTELPGDATTALTELATALKNAPDAKIRIQAHTDNLEGPQTSQAISEKRAAAVADWLAGHGVAKERITTQGFGSTQPVGDNNTEDGRARNRRIEVVKL